jgi:hypothetical protein
VSLANKNNGEARDHLGIKLLRASRCRGLWHATEESVGVSLKTSTTVQGAFAQPHIPLALAGPTSRWNAPAARRLYCT